MHEKREKRENINGDNPRHCDKHNNIIYYNYDVTCLFSSTF